MIDDDTSVAQTPLRRATVLLIVLFVCVGFVSSAYYYFVIKPEQAKNDIAAQTLTSEQAVYTDIAGSLVSMTDYDDTIRVVLFWASWVPEAPQALSALNELAGEINDPKVNFLAVNRNEPPTRAQAYLQTIPPLQHVTLVIDANDQLYKSLGGYAMPEIAIFSQSGAVLYKGRGRLDTAALAVEIEALLSE